MTVAGVRRRIFVAGAAALVCTAGGRAQDAREVIAERVTEHRQVLEPGVGLRVESMPGRLRILRVSDMEMAIDSRYAEGDQASSGAPFSVDRDGWMLTLRGIGDVDTPRRVVLRIPEDVALTLDLEGSEVVAADGAGAIDVTGKDLKMDFRGLQGELSVDVEGGSLAVEAHVGRLAIRGDRLANRIRSVTGDVTVNLSAGSLNAVSVDGETEVEASESEVVVRGVNRGFRLRAHGGSAVLEGLARGGHLRLEGTPLKLVNALGPVMVETDSQVRYHSLRAALHVVGVRSLGPGYGHHLAGGGEDESGLR